MPSALETLVKILRLERQQGYKNTAVIGGLGAFSQKWSQDAHGQARKPEHHVLVDELGELLSNYEQINSKNERHEAITYMLDRIMVRVQPVNSPQTPVAPPPESSLETPKTSSPPPAPPPRQQQPRQQERPPRQEQRQERRQESRQPLPRRPESRQSGDEWEKEAVTYDDPVMGRPDHAGQRRGGQPYRGSESDITPQPRLARPPRKPRPPTDPEAAADTLRALNKEITVLKGVGPKKAQLLSRLGI